MDEGIVLWMPGPRSFTGEDVLELHGHGGPVVMDLILTRMLALGARPARPGEFSERAFLNDRLDLAQAEAIADLIDSGSADAARAAARSLVGELSHCVDTLTNALTELRVYVEAAIDFPEEEIDFLGDKQIGARLKDIELKFDELFARTRQSALLRDGMSVVIAGAPNAGKSSLLNRLAGYDAAIVTEVAGTTRDVLREYIDLHGMPLHVIDTAGLRVSDDPVEREGVRRAQSEMAAGDRVLLVVDASTGEIPTEPLPAGVPVTVLHNKIDLVGSKRGSPPTQPSPRRGEGIGSPPTQPSPRRGEGIGSPPTQPSRERDGDSRHNQEFEDAPVIEISAKTGEGLDVLRAHLEDCVGYVAGESGVLMARRRHLEALQRARRHVENGRNQLERSRAGELLAEELRLAQRELEEITGVVTSDDLLGRIFSSFCIGK